MKTIVVAIFLFADFTWLPFCTAQDVLTTQRSLEEITRLRLKWGNLDENNRSREKYLEAIECVGTNNGKWVAVLVEKYGGRFTEGRKPIPDAQWLLACNVENDENVLLSCDASKANIKEFEPYASDGILVTLEEKDLASRSFVWAPSRNRIYPVDFSQDSGAWSLHDALRILEIDAEVSESQSNGVEKRYHTAQRFLEDDVMRVSRAFDDSSYFLIRQSSKGSVLDHVDAKHSKSTSVLTAEDIRSAVGFRETDQFRVKPVYAPNYLTTALPIIVTTEFKTCFVFLVQPDLTISTEPIFDPLAKAPDIPMYGYLRMSSDGESFVGLMRESDTAFRYELSPRQFVPTNRIVHQIAIASNERAVIGCNHRAVFRLSVEPPHQFELIRELDRFQK